MTCDQHQERILDYDHLTSAEQQSLDAHLRACLQCYEVAREWRALDKTLIEQLRAPELSADFDARLHQRIASEPAAASQTGLAERRHSLETEYAALRRRQNWRRWIPRLLDVLGFGVAGGLGGWLFLKLLTRAGAAWNAPAVLTSPQLLVASSAVGILIALGLITVAFNRPMRQALLR